MKNLFKKATFLTILSLSLSTLAQEMPATTSDLLQSRLEPGEAGLWHLYHSGFVIKTSNHLLIFDYWPGDDVSKNGRGLEAGIIDPEEIEDQNVVVFISHEHHDHWYRESVQWQNTIGQIRYIVSPEVAREDRRYIKNESVTVIAPNKVVQVDDLAIQTLLSTDSGVAFLVEVDGLTIYHSGDHACWNWDKDPKAEAHFAKALLKPLDGESIDIAMHVSDPRLKDGGWGGIFAFARNFKPGLLVPMHLKGNYKAVQEIGAILKNEKIPVSFWPVKARGDRYKYRSKK